MMKFFNTHFMPKKNVYTTNSYKGQIEDRYTGVKSYNGIVKDFQKDNFQTILKELSFVGVKLGISKKELLRNSGIPKATINITIDNDVQVLYYKHKIAQERARVEFHFYKKKLFYINVRFSTRNNRGNSDLVKVLESKYGSSLMSGEARFVNKQNNNALIIRNNLGVSLSYMLLDSEFFSLLDNKNQIDKIKIGELKELEQRYLFNNL